MKIRGIVLSIWRYAFLCALSLLVPVLIAAATLPTKDFIVAGYTSDSEGSCLPCFWVDGKKMGLSLPGSDYQGYGSDASIVGKSAYVAGDYWNENDNFANACYWVNGKMISLPTRDEKRDTLTQAIAVSGNSVYVAGVLLGGQISPCYWKDGELVVFEELGDAYDISVSDNSVVVVGYTYKPEESFGFPCYWENKKLKKLPIPAGYTNGIAYGVARSGKDLYISGYVYGDGINMEPCIWKNGAPVMLPSLGKGGLAREIVVTNGKAFVAGEIAGAQGSGSSSPCYWRDSSRVDLPLPNDDMEGSALTIEYFGFSLCIGGYARYIDGGRTLPCFWINGKYYELPLQDAERGCLSGFFARGM